MKLGDTWGSLRAVIVDFFSFSRIKELAGSAGLPIHQIAHLQQKPSGGASKGQLMDAIDELLEDLPPDRQDRFVSSCISEILRRIPSTRTQLEEVLARVGWGISGTEAYPLGLQMDLEVSDLPLPVRDGITNCVRRYRDGDTSGAITSICGIVDNLTKVLYLSNPSLGDHEDASYQERVARSFQQLGQSFKKPLKAATLMDDEINRLWDNYRGAVNQAAYVLGSFRRNFSDAHGVQTAPPELIQRALDCAVFIVRSLTGCNRLA